MILIDNKEDISYDNISDILYWKLAIPRISFWYILDEHGIDLHLLLHSNNLLDNIYHEINR
jgi:hypothetical protein